MLLYDKMDKTLVPIASPLTPKSVFLSIKSFLFTSTNKSNFFKKSVPIIGSLTSAITKFQSNSRRRPKDTLMRRSPKVFILDPFAAYNWVEYDLLNLSDGRGGKTEMSAPVSTKNFVLVLLSKIIRRAIVLEGTSELLLDRPDVQVSFFVCQTYMVDDIFEPYFRVYDDTSTNLMETSLLLQPAGCYGVLGWMIGCDLC